MSRFGSELESRRGWRDPGWLLAGRVGPGDNGAESGTSPFSGRYVRRTGSGPSASFWQRFDLGIQVRRTWPIAKDQVIAEELRLLFGSGQEGGVGFGRILKAPGDDAVAGVDHGGLAEGFPYGLTGSGRR